MSRAVIADGILYPSVVAVSDSLGLPIGRLRRVLTAASSKIDGHTVSYADEDAKRMIPGKCPKCGCTEAEQRFRLAGAGVATYNLETREISFEHLHDNIKYLGGTVLYCSECGRRLGSIDDAYDFKEL